MLSREQSTEGRGKTLSIAFISIYEKKTTIQPKKPTKKKHQTPKNPTRQPLPTNQKSQKATKRPLNGVSIQDLTI